MNIRNLSIALITAICLITHAQETPPKALIKVVIDKVKVGAATGSGTVILTLPQGFHGYQNPPMRDYEIPVKVESATKAFTLKPKYPKGVLISAAGAETMAYEGEVKVPFTFNLPKKPGTYTLEIKASYQLCNDSNCWPPESVSTKATFVVPKVTSR